MKPWLGVQAAVVALVLCPVAGAGAPAHADPTTGGAASVVIEWNRKANEIAFAEDQFQTFKGARAHAMAHIAQHDALNAVRPLFEQFAYLGHQRGASPIAAAAQAAREVIIAEYPGEQASIDALLADQLAGVPGGPRKRAGIALGRRSAAAILRARRGDGFDFEGSYSFEDEPGDYQTTPPFDGFVFQPGFRFARPFAVSSPDRFRPPPPPPLGGAENAAAFDEVKQMGRVDSERRTADQTAYAVWWMEFAEGSLNRLAGGLATRRRTNAWSAARLFAQLGAGLFDSYVAVWDSKFEYKHWRPYTAIRAAGADGNPGPPRTRPGSRCAQRRRFPSTSRRTPRSAAAASRPWRPRSATRPASRWRPRPPRPACRAVRSEASAPQPRNAPTRGYGWASTSATPPTRERSSAGASRDTSSGATSSRTGRAHARLPSNPQTRLSGYSGRP